MNWELSETKNSFKQVNRLLDLLLIIGVFKIKRENLTWVNLLKHYDQKVIQQVMFVFYDKVNAFVGRKERKLTKDRMRTPVNTDDALVLLYVFLWSSLYFVCPAIKVNVWIMYTSLKAIKTTSDVFAEPLLSLSVSYPLIHYVRYVCWTELAICIT